MFFSEYKGTLSFGVLVFIGLIIYGAFRLVLKKKNQGQPAVTKVDTDKVEPFMA